MIHKYGLKNNRRGGIEGLPMELLIIIVIATIGTAVVVGWMNNVEGQQPTTYGDVTSDVTMVSTDGTFYAVNGDTLCADRSFGMTIRVTNNNGDGVKDAVVKLSGLGVTGDMTFGQTDASGEISFKDLTLKTHTTGGVGYLVVSVSSSMGDTELKIPVVMV